MAIIINPGSRISNDCSGDGWTNTYQEALRLAYKMLEEIQERNIIDVDLILPGRQIEGDMRWAFGFRHRVTGVTVEYHIDGIDNLDAYRKEFVFTPRRYWNGSSTGGPEVEDWATPGFTAVKTFRPANDEETN